MATTGSCNSRRRRPPRAWSPSNGIRTTATTSWVFREPEPTGMTAERFDLVVIGGGAAGEKGAAQAAYFGKRVAVIERLAEPGGATVHTGTLPSKTLREAALFLSGYRQRDLYGVSV